MNEKQPISEVVYLRKEEAYFTDETIQSLSELGAVLRSIHDRLIAEGYIIKDGKIYREDVIQV